MRGQWGLGIAAALVLAGCQQQKPEDLEISKAWVRLPANPGSPGAAYFTIKAGPQATTLYSVSAENAIRAEMHDTVMDGGVMSMKKIDRIDIAAGQTVEFKPGGKHVMLYNLNPAIEAPRSVPLVFTFTDGRRFTINAQSVEAGK